MRLPRWFVVAILLMSVLLPASATAWLVIAPHLTAKRFRTLLAAGKCDEANAMLTNARLTGQDSWVAFDSPLGTFPWTAPAWLVIEPATCSLSDCLGGRRRFSVKTEAVLGTFEFEAGPRTVTFKDLAWAR